MLMRDVVELLTELNIKSSVGPHGVEFTWYFDSPGSLGRTGRYHYRIESGSGIAGRGNAWNMVELPNGEPCGPKVTTKRELRTQVLEALACGNRPLPADGHEVYARWHTYGATSSIQWFTRRIRK